MNPEPNVPPQTPSGQVRITFLKATLEPELAKAIAYRKEREAYHRRLVAEHLAKTPPSPMTPQRAAMYALLEKNRVPSNGEQNADYSQ